MKYPGLGQIASGCINGKKMMCVGLCPFKLDIPSFMLKLHKGNFAAAYRVLRDSLVFPDIVSRLCDAPCAGGCIRRAIDSSIRMTPLELACLANVERKDPAKPPMTPKAGRIAIIGAGLSGLALTLRLCSRGYQVTLFEKSSQPGGSVQELLPPDLVREEISRQMMHCSYEKVMSREITDLNGLDFDAVCIATGRGGADFGMRDPEAPAAPLGKQDGVFLLGGVIGQTPLQGIAQAAELLPMIEMYLQNGAIPAIKGDGDLYCDGMPTDYIAPLPGVMPADGVSYTKEEALQEAARCLRCNCTLCQDQCRFLHKYRKLPGAIDTEAEMILSGNRLCIGSATKLLNSCNMCGFCGAVCPRDIETKEIIRHHRQTQVQLGKMPPYHEYFLRDMDFSHQDARLLLNPAGDKTEYLFFPGCQLGASDPRYVKETYAFLLTKHPATALMLDCCSIPAEWAGDPARQEAQLDALREDISALGQPKLVFACTTCQGLFAERFPKLERISLYTLLAQDGCRAANIFAQPAAVFDPCGSRYDQATQDSVRQLLAAGGTKTDELLFSRDRSKCCSNGGHMAIANPELAEQIVDERIKSSPLPFVAYCANCRDIFAAAGKECAHLLELIFPIGREPGAYPTVSERRDNRLKLKRDLLEKYPGAQSQAPQQEAEGGDIRLAVADEVERQLHRDHILKQDIKQVISQAESSGRKLADETAGSFVAHLQIGNLTFWTEYRPLPDGSFEVLHAYTHRLKFA